MPPVWDEWGLRENDHARNHKDAEAEAEPETTERAGHFNEEVRELERLCNNTLEHCFLRMPTFDVPLQ